MTHRPILYGSKPCGCMGIVLHVDHDTDQVKIVKARRVIKRRGYTLEWLTTEEHRVRSWECPEHKAVRVRMAREKVAHQEGLALKG